MNLETEDGERWASSFSRFSAGKKQCVRTEGDKESWSELVSNIRPTCHVMHQQFNIQQLYALPHTVFMCFVFIWEQTATCVTYSINWLVFITQMKSVYSAVRTGALNKAVCASYLYG